MKLSDLGADIEYFGKPFGVAAFVLRYEQQKSLLCLGAFCCLLVYLFRETLYLRFLLFRFELKMFFLQRKVTHLQRKVDNLLFESRELVDGKCEPFAKNGCGTMLSDEVFDVGEKRNCHAILSPNVEGKLPARNGKADK